MSNDERLRDSGFAILGRPDQGEATWQHCTGLVVTQAEGIALLDGRSMKALRLIHAAKKKRFLPSPIRA